MEAHSLIPTTPNPKVQDFGPGDTVRVNFRIREGDRERVQAFQGVVIKRRKGGPGSTFCVRRVTAGIGIERTFPLFSPLIESVEIIRKGAVRRAKLYYLRGLSGKAARIKERTHPPVKVKSKAPLSTPMAKKASSPTKAAKSKASKSGDETSSP